MRHRVITPLNLSSCANVSSAIVRPLLNRLATTPINVGTLLSDLGLTLHGTYDRSTRQDRSTRIPFMSMMELWRIGTEVTDDPALGIHIAESLETGAFGIIDFLAGTTPTVHDGIQVACNYYPLIHDIARPVLEQQGGYYLWSYRLISELPLPPIIAESALGAWLALARKNVDGVLNPAEVHFVCRKVPSIAEYERFFRAPIRLGAERNALVMDAKTIQKPHKNANRTLLNVLEQYAQHLLQELPKSSTFCHRVREYIARELPEGDTSATNIASKLRVSTRTLRRRMGEEGLTYRQVLDELRYDFAKLYLDENGLTINEVADLLGFSDISAFYKAFNRWSRHRSAAQATPAKFRLNRKSLEEQAKA